MRRIIMAGVGLAAAVFSAAGVAAQDYTPVPVAADERSGPSRQIRCSVGQRDETACTFTPLFGDGSFQLDGPDIAVRLLIIDGEGSLFEVFGPERRVPVGGTYIRNPRDRACWITTSDGPSPVCAR
jgi:hypothetical protein